MYRSNNGKGGKFMYLGLTEREILDILKRTEVTPEAIAKVIAKNNKEISEKVTEVVSRELTMGMRRRRR